MQNITIAITAKDWMTNTTSATLRTIVLKSGDNAHWHKLIAGDYGDAIKTGVLDLVKNNKRFVAVRAGQEITFCKTKRSIELHIRAA